MDDRIMKCDFCSCSPHAVGEWIYDCKDFYDKGSQMMALAHWYACEQCSSLIENDDLKGLVDRSVITYMETHPDERRLETQLRNHIYQIHIKFWNHRKGARTKCQ